MVQVQVQSFIALFGILVCSKNYSGINKKIPPNDTHKTKERRKKVENTPAAMIRGNGEDMKWNQSISLFSSQFCDSVQVIIC